MRCWPSMICRVSMSPTLNFIWSRTIAPRKCGRGVLLSRRSATSLIDSQSGCQFSSCFQTYGRWKSGTTSRRLGSKMWPRLFLLAFIVRKILESVVVVRRVLSLLQLDLSVLELSPSIPAYPGGSRGYSPVSFAHFLVEAIFELLRRDCFIISEFRLAAKKSSAWAKKDRKLTG